MIENTKNQISRLLQTTIADRGQYCPVSKKGTSILKSLISHLFSPYFWIHFCLGTLFFASSYMVYNLSILKKLNNFIEKLFGGPVFAYSVRDYVIFFRKYEQPYPIGVDPVTNKLIPSLQASAKNPLYSPIVYTVSREIPQNKSINDYMTFFALLKLRALDVLRLFGGKDESFAQLLRYYQNLQSPCTIISIFLIQAETSVEKKSKIPLEYFSKVNYGHHYFLVVNQNENKKLIKKIKEMWKSDKQPEQEVLDCECSYMIDFNGNNTKKKIEDLWQIFQNHKKDNNYNPIIGKLSSTSWYTNTKNEKLLIDLFIELQKVADKSQAQPIELMRDHYDRIFNQRIPAVVQDFENSSNENERTQHLMNLKALMEVFVTQFFQYYNNKHVCCPLGIKKQLIDNIRKTFDSITGYYNHGLSLENNDLEIGRLIAKETTGSDNEGNSESHKSSTEIKHIQKDETIPPLKKRKTSAPPTPTSTPSSIMEPETSHPQEPYPPGIQSKVVSSSSSTEIIEERKHIIIEKEDTKNEPEYVFPDPLPPKPQTFTVLFLGETGVGKSTLISSLGNYLNWPTFEEANEHELQVCIPLEFKVQYREADGKIKHNVVKAGETDENENFNNTGQSVTQKPKVYQFTFQGNTVKVIDTPGLADSRGAEQDVKNLEMIRECVHQQDQIHAICIVLKSNDARLRPEFELAVRDYLSLFPKSALKNVFFFFTYASGTFFGIGESAEPVEEIQKKIEDSHEATFFFDSENACAVDSESFKYLLCKEQGVKYSDRPENNFVFCWKESASQVRDFLKFIQTVKPIEKETIIAVHHLATTALNLEEFLRTNNEVSEDVLQKLKKESKVIIAAARKHSMVCEYHRLITETKFKSNKKVEDALGFLKAVVREENLNLPFNITNCENTLKELP